MEYYEELKKALIARQYIDDYLERSKSIQVTESLGYSIKISKNENERYTFDGIADIIGQQNFLTILDGFKSQLGAALSKALKDADAEVARFTITKKEI